MKKREQCTITSLDNLIISLPRSSLFDQTRQFLQSVLLSCKEQKKTLNHDKFLKIYIAAKITTCWSFLLFSWRVCNLVSRVWGVSWVSYTSLTFFYLNEMTRSSPALFEKKNKSNMYHIHEQLTLECNDLFVLQFFIRLTWTTCSDTWIRAVANFSGTQNIWYGSLLINVEEMTSGRKFQCPPYSFRHQDGHTRIVGDNIIIHTF